MRTLIGIYYHYCICGLCLDGSSYFLISYQLENFSGVIAHSFYTNLCVIYPQMPSSTCQENRLILMRKKKLLASDSKQAILQLQLFWPSALAVLCFSESFQHITPLYLFLVHRSNQNACYRSEQEKLHILLIYVIRSCDACHEAGNWQSAHSVLDGI